jgi:protein gp37
VKSRIEWTNETWNPVTGCTKISSGCAHCYAERMARRLQAMGNEKYANGFEVTLHEGVLGVPLSWRSPRMIFVNSMSDLFHEDVPRSFIEQVFEVMRRASWHRFQVLTKRSRRLRELGAELDWPDSVWMGVTVESAEYLSRIDHLREVPAQVRFVSFEPLIGPIADADLTGVHWVIVGGESGPGARPMPRSWVMQVKRQCDHAGVPFFFKQWGGVNKKRNGRELQGKTWDALPLEAAPRT